MHGDGNDDDDDDEDDKDDGGNEVDETCVSISITARA